MDAPSWQSRHQRRQERKKERATFTNARKAESQYAAQLRKVAKHIEDLIRGFDPRSTQQVDELRTLLGRYAKVLRPWARNAAQRMLADVAARDEKVWAAHARRMGRALVQEIRGAPTGELMRRLLDEQVTLITSLPLEAAQRVHRLTTEQLPEGGRGESIIQEIMRTGEVTRNRATLIARTETSRTASLLTQARAQHIGSEGYIWRTAHDSDVRLLHRKLEGRFIRWDAPPIAGSAGERAHAGCIYNCRCYAEVVIPELPDEAPARPARRPQSERRAALAREDGLNTEVERLRQAELRIMRSHDRRYLASASRELQAKLAEFHQAHDANVAAGYHG